MAWPNAKQLLSKMQYNTTTTTEILQLLTTTNKIHTALPGDNRGNHWR